MIRLTRRLKARLACYGANRPHDRHQCVFYACTCRCQWCTTGRHGRSSATDRSADQ